MLKLSRPAAELFIPDGASWEVASARLTHLVVAAHADDVELIAWHAILHAETLVAVIVTDGRGSNTRLLERKRAASNGNRGDDLAGPRERRCEAGRISCASVRLERDLVRGSGAARLHAQSDGLSHTSCFA